mgnify:CR=1 FL=1
MDSSLVLTGVTDYKSRFTAQTLLVTVFDKQKIFFLKRCALRRSIDLSVALLRLALQGFCRLFSARLG